jgi:4-alpha-glucanotransferase
VGEFTDLEDFIPLCKKMRIGLIQLLPVNDTGYESSPYSSLTAYGLHPLYLRLEDLEEFKNAGPLTKVKIAEAQKNRQKEPRYSHQEILRLKMEVLQSLYNASRTFISQKAAPGNSLGLWIEENPWVKEYAVYRRLKELNEGKSWRQWQDYRDPSADLIKAMWNTEKYREEHLFWAWIQEALDRQFRHAAEAVKQAGIILKGDLPILMNEDSCDVWAHRNLFNTELSAGAPPDMYSPNGQNWGFPIYNWDAHEGDNYAWWRGRLALAGKYYQAYRIDHVLGFFRIWTCSPHDNSSVLGRYIPHKPITSRDLKKIGFDKSRIRWASYPHIPTAELWTALRNNWGNLFNEADIAAAANRIFIRALTRIGKEDLWLFKRRIKGEKDIEALDVHPAIRGYLLDTWHNRIFVEYEKGKFFPVWYYRNSRAWNTLSPEEQKNLETLFQLRRTKSEKVWEERGKKLLSILAASSSMLPCAEDLGAVPDCVPRVLTRLKILGLRVIRWYRRWDQDGQPYVPFAEYPELSVCTPAVHDSSTVREWWEREAGQEQFAGFIGVPSLPRIYNPGTAKIILAKAASAKSRFRVFQMQDLLHLSNKWYAPDPSNERINVPGTSNDFNWTYRLPGGFDEIARDRELMRAVSELSKVKPAKRES